MLRHFILTFAMAGLTTGLAAAQDLRDFGFTEGWNIMVDPQMGNGCLISGPSAKTVWCASATMPPTRAAMSPYLTANGARSGAARPTRCALIWMVVL